MKIKTRIPKFGKKIAKQTKKFSEEIRVIAREEAKTAVDGMKKRVSKSVTTATFLRRRTGRLYKSLGFRTRVNVKTLTIFLGAINNPPKYARIQEEGGTITSERNMTIPTDAARDARGVAKFTAREAISNFDTFSSRLRSGRLGIFARMGGEERPTLIFVLTKKVKIPARPYIAPESDKMIKRVLRRANKVTNKVFRG